VTPDEAMPPCPPRPAPPPVPVPASPQDAARTWVLAGRDGELAAWRALYDALYPPPDTAAGALAGAPGRAA
jgi:hypothetical protein